jgi:hypothetical protein
MPALVATATAFHDGKYRRFLLALTLLLLTKEVFTLTAMSLGALAFIRRREARWIWVPFAMGLGYGLFLRYGFFPMMLGDRQYYYDSMLPEPGELAGRLFSRPSLVYLGMMILWGGSAIALRNTYALLALPPAFLNLVLGHVFIMPENHYAIEIVFWMFFAGVTAHESGKPERETLFAFLVCLLLMNLTLIQNIPFYLRHRYADSYDQVFKRLPPDAVVALGEPIDDHAWKIHREYLIRYDGYGGLRPCTWARLMGLQGVPGEYAVLHRGAGMFRFAPEEKEHVRECWDEMKRDPAYRTVWEDSVITLIRKVD